MKSLDASILFFVYLGSIILQGMMYYFDLHNIIHADQTFVIFSANYLFMAITALMAFRKISIL